LRKRQRRTVNVRREISGTSYQGEAMKGVVFLGDRKLELREFPDPTPGPRDVVLEIKASGMCGSDLHTYRAPAQPGGAVAGGIKRQAGVIAGHEPCGVDARAAAVRAVRSWGTACFVGERGQVTLDVSPDLLRRQVTLVGSWTFSKQGQAECAEFVADRRVDVERLFTHRWKLEQAEEAYRLFDTQTTGKAVILPS
jgi:threonine dehydrogenase-like Zn-dependent dehydrogenase